MQRWMLCGNQSDPLLYRDVLRLGVLQDVNAGVGVFRGLRKTRITLANARLLHLELWSRCVLPDSELLSVLKM